jgi:2-(1,2-epoxy-1,2-dihydrophenyl)acetyl-CoA isomerase
MSSSPSAPAVAPVLLEHIEDGIAYLSMNRPEKLNALNNELATALNQVFERLGKDEAVRVIVLSGEGRAFCAGGDLVAIGKGREARDRQQLEPILRAGMGAMLRMRIIPQPVIACVNGPAAGAGMNVALAADIRIAAEEAVFGQNFSKIGLFPDYGGTYFLPQLIGPAKAAELFYTGDMFDAMTAWKLGLVNRVVPGAQLKAEGKRLAVQIAAGPPIAIRAVKQTLFGNEKDALSKAMEAEVHHQMRCFASEDSLEGIRAFFEKRPPKFQGR